GVARVLLAVDVDLVRLVRRAVAADTVRREAHAPLGEELTEVDLALPVVLDVQDAGPVVGVQGRDARSRARRRGGADDRPALGEEVPDLRIAADTDPGRDRHGVPVDEDVQVGVDMEEQLLLLEAGEAGGGHALHDVVGRRPWRGAGIELEVGRGRGLGGRRGLGAASAAAARGQQQEEGGQAAEGAAQNQAAGPPPARRFMRRDLRLAAWFLWMMPLVAALSMRFTA